MTRGSTAAGKGRSGEGLALDRDQRLRAPLKFEQVDLALDVEHFQALERGLAIGDGSMMARPILPGEPRRHSQGAGCCHNAVIICYR